MKKYRLFLIECIILIGIIILSINYHNSHINNNVCKMKNETQCIHGYYVKKN